MTLEEMKEKFLKGTLQEGLFTSTNESNDNVVVGIDKDGFRISTHQSNGWVRTNEYTYDKEYKEWIIEESYEK